MSTKALSWIAKVPGCTSGVALGQGDALRLGAELDTTTLIVLLDREEKTDHLTERAGGLRGQEEGHGANGKIMALCSWGAPARSKRGD